MKKEKILPENVQGTDVQEFMNLERSTILAHLHFCNTINSSCSIAMMYGVFKERPEIMEKLESVMSEIYKYQQDLENKFSQQ